MNAEEAKFNRWLREQFFGHFIRVENTTSNGTPDINVCYKGEEIWIESKIHTARGVLVRPEQHAWLFKRGLNGGKVYVVARRDDFVDVYAQKLEVEVAGEYLRITSLPTWSWHRRDFIHFQDRLFETPPKNKKFAIYD